VSGDGALVRLSALLEAASVTEVQALVGARTVAVGWATVELDRAVVELGDALRVPPASFAVAGASHSLGASCLVAAGVLPGGVALVVLEPNTEGRLAATLARNDEGPAAAWLAVERLADAVTPLRGVGTSLAAAEAGPFGPECLILDGAIRGPYRLLIERPGTILE